MYAQGYTQEIPVPSPCGLTARNKSIKHRSLEQDPAPTDTQSTIIAAAESEAPLPDRTAPWVNLTVQRGFYTILQEQSLSGIWRGGKEVSDTKQERVHSTRPFAFWVTPRLLFSTKTNHLQVFLLHPWHCSADAIFLMLALSQASSLFHPSHSSH